MSLNAGLLLYRAMDCKLAELRACANLTRTWIHMDMDAFFASVEELDDPSLVRPPQSIKYKALSVRLCDIDMVALSVARSGTLAHSACESRRRLS